MQLDAEDSRDEMLMKLQFAIEEIKRGDPEAPIGLGIFVIAKDPKKTAILVAQGNTNDGRVIGAEIGSLCFQLLCMPESEVPFSGVMRFGFASARLALNRTCGTCAHFVPDDNSCLRSDCMIGWSWEPREKTEAGHGS